MMRMCVCVMADKINVYTCLYVGRYILCFVFAAEYHSNGCLRWYNIEYTVTTTSYSVVVVVFRTTCVWQILQMEDKWKFFKCEVVIIASPSIIRYMWLCYLFFRQYHVTCVAKERFSENSEKNGDHFNCIHLKMFVSVFSLRTNF